MIILKKLQRKVFIHVVTRHRVVARVAWQFQRIGVVGVFHAHPCHTAAYRHLGQHFIGCPQAGALLGDELHALAAKVGAVAAVFDDFWV